MGSIQAVGFKAECADPVFLISAAWEELEKTSLFPFFLKNFLRLLKPVFLERIICLLCAEARVHISPSRDPLNYCVPLVSLQIAPLIILYHLSMPLLVLRLFVFLPFLLLHCSLKGLWKQIERRVHAAKTHNACVT